MCSYHTGTSYDIFKRFERTASRLNATLAPEKGWSNSKAITLTLEGLKSLSFDASYSPGGSAGFSLISNIALAVENTLGNISMTDVQNMAKIVEAATANSSMPDIPSLPKVCTT